MLACLALRTTTHDYQKAVLNEVHSIPDKPITIEYDPKTMW